MLSFDWPKEYGSQETRGNANLVPRAPMLYWRHRVNFDIELTPHYLTPIMPLGPTRYSNLDFILLITIVYIM